MAKSASKSGFGSLLGVLMLLLLGAAAWLFWRGAGDAGGSIAQATVRAQVLAAQAADAVKGQAGSFDELAKSRSSMVPASDIAALASADERGTIQRAWTQLLDGADTVLAGREPVLAGFDAAATVDSRIEALQGAVAALAGSLSGQAVAANSPPLERVQLMLLSLAQDLRALATGTGNSAAAIARLRNNDAYIDQVLRGLAGEDTGLGVRAVSGADDALGVLAADYSIVSSAVRNGINSATGATDARRGLKQLNESAASLAGVSARSGLDAERAGSPLLPLGLLGGGALAGLGLMLTRRQPAAVPVALSDAPDVKQSDENQQAILRLLDEMGSLADGDLTVEATVTEDVTGAIADSINYAIEALRDLVSTIDSAATQVSSAASQTEATATHLARASENQSKQVAAATESIANMASSIEEVSGNAERSADVARHSVEIAHKGGEAVRRTIDGMNTIRETIQDTSKRIKRLGESSQEIGNIVELINDIAEQTNILALNASIQASMAGEAGRGFAVVADEVQRLAERSTNATKQIEVLVKTIQSDTNEAVVSMERSTTDVVSGALLAENAGAALVEIEKVSNQIASLVQNISGTARQQAMAAADITRNMGVLQEISAQTAENTSAASRSIGNLAAMSTALSKSVERFTLPKDVADKASESLIMEEVPILGQDESRDAPEQPEPREEQQA